MRHLIVFLEAKFSKDVNMTLEMHHIAGTEAAQALHAALEPFDRDVDVFSSTGEPQSVDQFLANHAPPEPDEDDLKTRTRALLRALKDNESRFDWPAGIVGFIVQCMDEELRPPGGWGAEGSTEMLTGGGSPMPGDPDEPH